MERHAKSMQTKAKRCEVEPTRWPHIYKVTSPSGSEYVVNTEANGCGCDWHKYHPQTACSHLLAAMAYEHEASKGRRLSFWNDQEAARRQHRPVVSAADVLATSRAMA